MFRTDFLQDELAGSSCCPRDSLKSPLQHHSSKASIFWRSAFFIVQLSHPYITTGKTIALTRQTSFGKVMSLFFNMLSRLVIAFLPRSKHLLVSWLQSPSAVILEPPKIKSLFPLFPIYFAIQSLTTVLSGYIQPKMQWPRLNIMALLGLLIGLLQE